MAWPTLNATPDYGSNLKVTPVVDELMFGEGYGQVSEPGLNGRLQTKPMIFKRPPAEAKAIYDQLRAWGGVTTFGYVHPTEGVRVGVRTVGEIALNTDNYGFHTVTATFKEVAEVET